MEGEFIEKSGWCVCIDFSTYNYHQNMEDFVYHSNYKSEHIKTLNKRNKGELNRKDEELLDYGWDPEEKA